MTTEQTINNGIKEAMLAKDKIRLDALRAIKAAVLSAKTAENAREFDETSFVKMLQKMVKQRREAAEIYKSNNRPELADKELSEAVIIEEFLPARMSESEITDVLKNIIAAVGAVSPKDMGKVMSEANKQLSGKADGRLIAGLVKSLLNN